MEKPKFVYFLINKRTKEIISLLTENYDIYDRYQWLSNKSGFVPRFFYKILVSFEKILIFIIYFDMNEIVILNHTKALSEGQDLCFIVDSLPAKKKIFNKDNTISEYTLIPQVNLFSKVTGLPLNVNEIIPDLSTHLNAKHQFKNNRIITLGMGASNLGRMYPSNKFIKLLLITSTYQLINLY